VSGGAAWNAPFWVDAATMSDDLAADLKEFIAQHIHSLAQLELLLMLRRDRAGLWTAEEVMKALYIQKETAEDLMADLVQRGFAVQEAMGVRYEPANDMASFIERLAQLYLERRVAVTTEIYSKPVNSVKAFADAFRLRKKE
jgi:hypothetical protein